MGLLGNEGLYISETEAYLRHGRYVEMNGNNPDLVRSQFFGREMLQEMLSRPGAVGIKFLNTLCSENQHNLVLIPVDSNGKRLPKDRTGLKDDDGGDAGSDGPRCPKACY